MDWTQKLARASVENRFYSLVFAISLSVVSVLLTYLVLVPLLRTSRSVAIAYLVSVLSERGFIPYIIVFFFFLMMSFLLLNLLELWYETYAFWRIRNGLKLRSGMVYTDSLNINSELKKDFADVNGSLIVKRIEKGMDRLFNTQDTNALTEYFKLRSEIEYSEMDSNFSTIRYLNWLIPTLGFIGTVLGIGLGIAGFAGIIQNAQSFNEIKSFLPNVTNSLGVAFDTTFLALILSVVGMFFTAFISKKYSQLLEEIDSYCLDDISSRFKIHSTVAEQMRLELDKIKNEVELAMRTNRIEIDHMIKDELKVLVDLINQIIPSSVDSLGNQMEAHLVNIHQGLVSAMSNLSQNDMKPLIVMLKKIYNLLSEKDKKSKENHPSEKDLKT